MSGWSRDPAAPTCRGQLVSDWCPQQQQYLDVTSGGHNNTSSSGAAASYVHPLVHLLLHSDRHLPPSRPYTQPISTPAVSRPSSHAGTAACHHGDGVFSRPLVKKPLNAFMLFMKEARPQVLQEARGRQSAAINRILGHRWHALPESERSKYYKLAQEEALLHMRRYPGWTAKDNYGKRKRRQQNQQRSGTCSGSDQFSLQDSFQ